MKKCKIFFKTVEKANGYVFWNGIIFKQLGGKKVEIENEKYDVKSNIQTMLTNTKATTKLLNNDEKMTVYKVCTDLGFYNIRPKKKGNKSARVTYVTNDLPKALKNF